MHKEINEIIEKKQSEIDNINTQHLVAIEKQEEVIHKALNDIKKVIQDINSMLYTSDVGLVSK